MDCETGPALVWIASLLVLIVLIKILQRANFGFTEWWLKNVHKGFRFAAYVLVLGGWLALSNYIDWAICG